MSNSSPLAACHGHQLQRLVAFQRLVLAGFQGGMGGRRGDRHPIGVGGDAPFFGALHDAPRL